MKAVILASGVSRPRKSEKSSMGFAEVLQIRQRLLAWNNPEHPYQQRFFANQTLIVEAFGSQSGEVDLDEAFRKRCPVDALTRADFKWNLEEKLNLPVDIIFLEKEKKRSAFQELAYSMSSLL
jgi:hypothetical protein